MKDYSVYEKAIKKLFLFTYGKIEHGENKAIELFDKLIDRGTEIHQDELKKLCKQAGYPETDREEISQIYDIIYRYKKLKRIHWTDEMIEGLYIGGNNE